MNKDLHKNSYSPLNRLQSIIYDAEYIEDLALILGLPVVANERCGSWYVRNGGSCYFKSTDGHTNEWKFSYRRLNYHLMKVVEESGGVMVVDSTRKGKLMPDALSKTIPIWCAVLNYMNFGPPGPPDHTEVGRDLGDVERGSDEFRGRESEKIGPNWLRLPKIIPATERDQIANKIPEFAAEAQRLKLTIKLAKPLVPYWVYPGTAAPVLDHQYYAVVCATASRPNLHRLNFRQGTETIAFDYVQGAGDDHELWVRDLCDGQLDAAMFWRYYPKLTGDIYLTMSNEQLRERLSEVHGEVGGGAGSVGSEIGPGVGSRPGLGPGLGVPSLTLHPIKNTGIMFGKITTTTALNIELPTENLVILSHKIITNVPKSVTVHHYPIDSNKKGSKELRAIFPKLMPKLNCSTVVVCDTGQDLCVGVVLILLCLNYTAEFQKIQGRGSKDLIKQFIRELNDISSVNPSRNTLQSVNSYLFA